MSINVFGCFFLAISGIRNVLTWMYELYSKLHMPWMISDTVTVLFIQFDKHMHSDVYI